LPETFAIAISLAGGRNAVILAHSRAMPVPPATASPDKPVIAPPAPNPGSAPAAPQPATAGTVAEIGGPRGPDPTRFGDWERAGRCIDF
jgi:hypothetical protein